MFKNWSNSIEKWFISLKKEEIDQTIDLFLTVLDDIPTNFDILIKKYIKFESIIIKNGSNSIKKSSNLIKNLT